MKVFISYAREDWEIAERVWSDLKLTGIDAWIDRKELLPGQNWKTEISKAIRASSHFIALLSTRSVSKQGFFQTELKKAIDVLDTFPEHRIYFIPVRIDNCEPSYERLGDIHWADLFPSYEEGLSQILRVLAPGHRVETATRTHTVNTMPEEKLLVQKPKYQLRKEPIIVSEDEVQSKFGVDKDWRPLEYIQNNFKDNGDGTITDYATGLMWQKSGSHEKITYQAHSHIKELNRKNFGCYNDWHIPTIDELKSLVEKEEQSNGLYINPLFDSIQYYCMSSDQYGLTGTWGIRFLCGSIAWNGYESGGGGYVRAVRSVQ